MTTSTLEHDALKRAVLDTLVPQDTKSSITDILDEAEDEETQKHPSLLHVKQRNLLFFGKLFNATIVIPCPPAHSWCDR